MERWAGKTAVVTGAGGGIGQAVAEQLHQNGLIVVGLDINIPSELSKVNYYKCDITKRSELTEAFQWVEDHFGGVALMANCAGYAKLGHITSVGLNQISEDELERIFDVNIKGVALCTRHAVDSMKRHNFDGHIVNINSIAGHYVAFTDTFNAYSSSKYAVTAFTQSLAVELATFNNKIKTTSISPGLVKTAMSSQSVKDFSAVPHLLPKDIADAVMYVIGTPPHVNITEMTVQPVAELRM